jgi:hypothetical protein
MPFPNSAAAAAAAAAATTTTTFSLPHDFMETGSALISSMLYNVSSSTLPQSVIVISCKVKNFIVQKTWHHLHTLPSP